MNPKFRQTWTHFANSVTWELVESPWGNPRTALDIFLESLSWDKNQGQTVYLKGDWSQEALAGSEEMHENERRRHQHVIKEVAPVCHWLAQRRTCLRGNPPEARILPPGPETEHRSIISCTSWCSSCRPRKHSDSSQGTGKILQGMPSATECEQGMLYICWRGYSSWSSSEIWES